MEENANPHKVRNMAWLVVSIIVVVSLFAYALSATPKQEVVSEGTEEQVAIPVESVVDWVNLEAPEPDWLEYQNKRIGFSFWYPPMIREQSGTTTLEIFDNGKTSHVYLRKLRNFVLGKDYTWEDLEGNDSEMNWRISERVVTSDKALTRFINDVFEGTDCVIDSSNPVIDVNDLNNVTIKASGTNTSDDFGGCPVNYRYVVKYAPKLGKAAAWRIGQDDNFINILSETQATTTINAYDDAIANSFRFIK